MLLQYARTLDHTRLPQLRSGGLEGFHWFPRKPAFRDSLNISFLMLYSCPVSLTNRLNTKGKTDVHVHFIIIVVLQLEYRDDGLLTKVRLVNALFVNYY